MQQNKQILVHQQQNHEGTMITQMALQNSTATLDLSILRPNIHWISNNQSFFEQQIQIQPPDISNPENANYYRGQQPFSIPAGFYLDNSNNKNVKDLLLKAKAGMQAGDLQKEAHLTYILASVHEQNRNFSEAIKYYKKFYATAKIMNDSIGKVLAFNRIGWNYHQSENHKKSLDFHQQCLEISERDNDFTNFYNCAISQRNLGEFVQSMELFKKALFWSLDKDEIQSECLCYGQIGVTYTYLQEFDNALENLSKCYDMSVKLNNSQLKLDCLTNLIKISEMTTSSGSETVMNILDNALQCAKQIQDKKTFSLSICNMGVIDGRNSFNDFKNNFKYLSNDDYQV